MERSSSSSTNDIKEASMARRVSRRAFLKTTAVAGVSAAAFGVPAIRVARADNEIVVTGWGGQYEEAMKQAMYDPFTKATGIRIRMVSATAQTFAQLKAQVETK